MTKHQMKKYVEVRKKEIDMDERKQKFAKRGDADTSSVYRAFSRLVCNFAFPNEIPRQFPKDIRLKKKALELHEDDNSDEEDKFKLENAKKKNKDIDVEYVQIVGTAKAFSTKLTIERTCSSPPS